MSLSSANSAPAPEDKSSTATAARPSLWVRYRLLISVGLAVALLDQWTKALVRAYLPFAQIWAPWPAPWRQWIRIVHWRNTGAAFGLYQGANDMLLWVAVFVIAFVVWHFRHAALEARCLRWGLALQVGGALGNLWDRVMHGSVTDFIAVARFPVFNLADVAITLGVVCLLWSTLLDETPEDSTTVAASQSAAPAAGSEADAQPPRPPAGERP